MPETDQTPPVARGPLAGLLVCLFFVSPLVFFTDLTRNPYYLQITLLNASLLLMAGLYLAAGFRRGDPLPATPLNKPLTVLLLAYAASTLAGYFGHPAFFRPAILSEGTRAWAFLLVNCVLVFYLSYKLPWVSDGGSGTPVGKWLALLLVWGGLWLFYPWLKAPAGGGMLARMLDPYGTMLWLAGFAAVFLLVRRCTQEAVLELAMAVGALASLYGVLEYFHVEFIWAKLINPYGNRSVSTFGNPNFVSSYVVMLLPLAAWRLLRADSGLRRFYYGLVFLSYEGMLLASLTRSSWLGAAAGLGLLAALVSARRGAQAVRLPKSLGVAALALLFLWPSSSLKPFSSGLLDRVSEASSSLNTPSAFGLTGDQGRIYASFHQRLLIWTSAWQMGKESPLLGKGWGSFELFYPFYQGRLLLNFPEVRGLRTHANNAHNEFLEQWSQAGLLGLGAFAWLLASLFAAGWRFYRAAADDAAFEAAALGAGLAGMLVDNMLNVSLHFAVPGLLFWWLAGALVRRSAGASPVPDFTPWRRPAAGLAALAAGLALCVFGARYWERQFTREMHYFSGFKAMRQSNFAGAAAELKKAWEAHPREVNSNYEMGNAYVRIGDAEKGAWAYTEALKSNAGYDEIYFNLAITDKKLGRRAEAIEHLRTSSFINPLNLVTWQALAEVYLAAEDKAKLAAQAAADFTEAVRVFPLDANLWNTLGYFQTLRNDFPAARKAYAAGVRAEPGNAMLGANLAGVVRKLGLQRDPDLLWLQEYLALEQEVNRPQPRQGALEAAQRLAAGDPGGPRSLALLSKFYFKAGRLGDAKASLQELLRRNPADTSSRYGLAVIYEKEGNFPAARAEWGRLLEYEPGNAAVAERMRALPR